MVLWVVGAVINVFGSILINGGTNFMKLGHNRRSALEEEEETETPPVRKIGAWQLGFGLFIIGNLFNFGSFAFAAQSILAALGSVQFIANVVFGRLILKETITKRILLATALIVAGCVIIVSFGNHSSETFSSKQLQNFYKSEGYQAYLCVASVLFVASYSLYRYGNTLRKKRGEAMDSTSTLWLRLLPTCYSIFAALLGAQSVLFSKAISLMLRTTIQGSGQLSSWFVWVNLLLFLGAAFFWVTRLNLALRLFPAVVIVPTMQIAWTLASIISGMVFYQEYRGLGATKAVMFAVGVVLVFWGVWTLTSLPSAVCNDQPWGGLDDSYDRSHTTEFMDRNATGDSLQNGRSWQTPKSQLEYGMSGDGEQLPLSPQKTEPFPGPSGKRATGNGQYNSRIASIFNSLTAHFRQNFKATSRQIGNAAEHMAPPYDLPAAASRHQDAHSKRVLKSKQSNLEMGAALTAVAASASASNRLGNNRGTISDAGHPNLFAGGFSRTSMSGASDDSEPTHRMFDNGYILSDDDPVSPTWADANSRRVSDFDGGQSRV